MNRSTIPIEKVNLRKSHTEDRDLCLNNKHAYPYLINEQDNLSIYHIRDCLNNWNSYSSSLKTNIHRVSQLLNMTESKLPDYINEVEDTISNYIIPYIDNPNFYTRLFENSKVIKDSIKEQVECDRLLSNYNAISKRFNIDKHFIYGINENRSLTDIIYSFCDMIDTYDSDYKTKFCIATECALYINDKNYLNIPTRAIFENIIDYHLMQYGNRNMEKFIDNMKDSIEKDRFIDESAEEYIDFLNDVYTHMNENIYSEDIENHFNSNSDITIVEAYDEYKNLSNSLKNLYESAMLDKADRLIARYKISLIKNKKTIENAIKSLLVVHRLRDIKKGTSNALSLVFFSALMGGAFAFGAIPGILGLITTYTLQQSIQEVYLRDSIKAWENHKEMVENKLDNTYDNDTKKKLISYIAELDNNIDLLKEKLVEYDSERRE